ncbi:MAG: type VI secretion system lipoprotein TssJ [Rhodothalassiaceae bacterium]
MRHTGFKRGLAALAIALATAGCGAKEMVFGPDDTKIRASISASDTVNPDLQGRASPVVVRTYLLRSPTAFQNADFFAVYQNEAGTLGQDLLERQEFFLEPGQSLDKEFLLTEDSGATHLGVIAAFRDLDEAQWRQVYAPDLGKTEKIRITADGVRLRIEEQ